MKKYLLLLIILLPSVLAQESISASLYRESYHPRETLQLEFTASNLAQEPSTANIKLFDPSGNEIKVAPFLLNIKQNDYFVYFDLPDDLVDGLYTLRLSRLKLNVNNVLKETNQEINFNISKSNSAISINPAVFIINKDKKELQVQLNNRGYLVDIKLTASDFIKHPYTKSEQLTGSSSRKFYFDADPSGIVYDTKGFINISYSNESYTIPIFVIIGSSEPIQAFEFITELTSLSRTLNKKEELSGSLGIKNRLDKTLNNINFELTGNLNDIIKLNTTYIPSLESQATINELFEINQDKNPQFDSYLGNFIVKSDVYSASFPIYIKFTEASEAPKVETKPKEEIREHELFTLPPPVPVSIEPESKSGFYLIIFVLVVIAAIIYKLSRKEKQKKSFKEYLSGIKR